MVSLNDMTKRKAYKKHFVEEVNKNEVLKYPVKKWAINHKNAFPSKGFTNATNDYPTTHEIVAVMVKDYGYTKVEINGEVIIRKRTK